MSAIKFAVVDEEDLEIVSAHVQDAIVRSADVIWRPGEHRVVIGLNRFDWEEAVAREEHMRRRTALRFERVMACRCRSLDPANKDEVLNLLAVEFDESDPPGGTVTLHFSGGAALRLEVECLEAELADLGPAWQASCCPQHKIEDETQPGGNAES